MQIMNTFLDGYISRSRSAGMITPLSFEHTLNADLNDYFFQHTNTNKPVLLIINKSISNNKHSKN